METHATRMETRAPRVETRGPRVLNYKTGVYLGVSRIPLNANYSTRATYRGHDTW